MLCSAIGSATRVTPHLLAASSFLLDYPFANRLFPGSLDAIEHIADLVDYDLPALLGASRAKEAR